MKLDEFLNEAQKFPSGPGLDFVADQLSNDEVSSDEELIKHLVKQTKNPRAVIAKLVKDKRSYFMNSVVKQTDARALLRKYIKMGW